MIATFIVPSFPFHKSRLSASTPTACTVRVRRCLHQTAEVRSPSGRDFLLAENHPPDRTQNAGYNVRAVGMQWWGLASFSDDPRNDQQRRIEHLLRSKREDQSRPG